MNILIALVLALVAMVMQPPAETSTPATRGEAIQLTPTLPPPEPEVTILPGDWKCPQWFDTAIEAGWPERLWPELDHVMWGESRCNPNLYTDARSGPQFVNDMSYGLLQINVKPGIGTQPFFGPLVEWDWARLFDPHVNLWVGWERYAANLTAGWTGGCGWWGWTVARKAGFC